MSLWRADRFWRKPNDAGGVAHPATLPAAELTPAAVEGGVADTGCVWQG